MENRQVFQKQPVLLFRPELGECPQCHLAMKVQKTRKRTIVLYSTGPVTACETIMVCPQCSHTSGSQELAALVAARHTFGYDVITYIGQALFVKSRSDQEIQSHLNDRGIQISASEIAVLAKKYICYLALAHEECAEALKVQLEAQGGYILHLDGTCDSDSPHLFVGLDEISSIVLNSVKIPSEKSEVIIPFLKEIKRTYGEPAALVHDMGRGILRAVAKVFPDAPDYICHFHFLRDIGKDLLARDHDRLRSKFRYHGIQTKLRSILRDIRNAQAVVLTNMQAFSEAVKSSKGNGIAYPEQLYLYTLIQWALAGKSEGDGYGFPFDRPYLTFLNRLYELRKTLHAMHLNEQSSLAAEVLAVLKPLWYDREVSAAYANLQKKVLVFDRLRRAMRIAEPEGKLGLNDPGNGEVLTLKEQVEEFMHQLCSDDTLQKFGYQKMKQQIEKYWDKLFAAPVTLTRQGIQHTIYPQRTNNILEQFFRTIKHAHCRKSGHAGMTKTLTAMLSATPLVQNLGNPGYLKLILNGCSRLEERFAQIDVSAIRKLLDHEAASVQQVDPKIKKLIKDPNLPKLLIKLARKPA